MHDTLKPRSHAGSGVATQRNTKQRTVTHAGRCFAYFNDYKRMLMYAKYMQESGQR